MDSAKHQVVIVGGGFGGLYAAQAFANCNDVEVTLIDRRNFHLFQPLLYQVATGGLSPGEIASPLRAVLSKQKNCRVLMGEVTGFDVESQQVVLRDGAVPYDELIIATGCKHSYFGNNEWEQDAPGLKTVEDAVEIRRRVFLAFEGAERETDPEKRKQWLRFVIVGGGPTGVELAGALGELAHHTLRKDFHHIDTTEAEIILLEGAERVLPPYHPMLSAEAEGDLKDLGVEVRPGCFVNDVKDGILTYRKDGQQEQIAAKTVLWAAGVEASPLGRKLAEATGANVDRIGRVKVEPDLSVPNHPNVRVIGDLGLFLHQGDKPLPGIAPVAMQQGAYAAKTIRRQLQGKPTQPFRYVDRGMMAVIGRHAAVADVLGFRFTGIFAWLLWLFVHVLYLVEFDNRLLVAIQWAWCYFTKNRGARLVTNQPSLELVEEKPKYDSKAA